jgi:hypothetical protein
MQKPGIELEMVELLYKRLTKNSCDVKLKTLRCMHFISRRGSVAFRRAMQRGSQQIRVHLSKFRPNCPPHATKSRSRTFGEHPRRTPTREPTALRSSRELLQPPQKAALSA